jgi:hypothetical protein
MRFPEATAILRRSGRWTVQLGSGRFWELLRLQKTRSSEHHDELEAQLGLLALSLGRTLATLAALHGQTSHLVRVSLKETTPSQPSVDELPPYRVRGSVMVECEATRDAVQRYLDEALQKDPFLLSLAPTVRLDELRVAVRSSIQLRVT